jgi:hypothetical protein
VNRPAVFWEELPSVLKHGVSIPGLSVHDQATGSGRATSVLDCSRVLTRKHQWSIGTGGEGIRSRVRPRLHFECSLNVVSGGKGGDSKDCESDESHIEERYRWAGSRRGG